jgi:hypothetical protein
MAVSIKISQLLDGGNVQSQDVLPVARAGETYKIPASQFVIGGQNLGAGSGQIFFGKTTGAGSNLQFRSLSGVEGITVGTQGQTLIISTSGQNPVKTRFFGDGITTTFPIIGANSINSNNYRIDIDGVLQEPGEDYNINGSNIAFTSAPPLSSKVVVVSNNLVRAYDIVPSDGSITTSKLALSSVTTNIINDNAVTPAKLSIGGPNWNSAGGTTITTLSVLQYFHYPPDYDSGWFNMSSQAGVNSYRELNHNLGQYPAHIKVLTRAIDGNNNGFIFEGMGSAMHDDEGASEEYGGLIFAYNQTKVRLWAPDVNNAAEANGRIIFVSDGWGGEINSQTSQTAQVRVLAWRGFYNLD